MTISRRRWLDWLPIVLGTLLAITMLDAARHRIVGSLDTAAFGRDTQNVIADIDNIHVHCSVAEDSKECLDGYAAAGKPPAILWLGNSQLAAINRYTNGDRTASSLLYERLRKRGYHLVTYSQPNANLFEHGLIYTALVPKYDLRAVILPVFLDDIREQGIRPMVSAFLDEPAVRTRLEQSRLWPYLAASLGKAKGEETPVDGPVPLQKRFESWLNDRLGQYSELWASRPMLKGYLGIALHCARNKLVGIDARTKRKVDPAVYHEKMQVLEAILQDARERKIRVLLYIPPYRHDIDGPYIASDYATLKKDLAAFALKYGAEFADIDDAVPGPEWATVVDTVFGIEDYDFMHFTAAGHRRHADALDGVLLKMGF